MIFHHICFFQLFCKVLAFFANSPFDQGHLAESQLNFSHSFCDLSPYIFFSTFLSGFGLFCQFAIWPGTSRRVSIKFQSLFLWSFTIYFFFNFSVRFWPFLPIRHLTRDISLSRHYIFVARFVIFHHICHFNLSGYVFVGFELPVISTNLFTFFGRSANFTLLVRQIPHFTRKIFCSLICVGIFVFF